MGRHGDRPSLNFNGFLAGKSVHVAPKKDGLSWILVLVFVLVVVLEKLLNGM
jgi:hypothetical protein